MREIKFRTWDKDGKKMLEVTGLETFDNRHIYYKKEMICNAATKRGDAVEIMQYTGLKDKKGKEIYEGDIVKLVGDARDMANNFYEGEDLKRLDASEVVYKGHGFFADVMQSGYEGEMEFDLTDCKVIGNRFEHPNLLSDTSHKPHTAP